MSGQMDVRIVVPPEVPHDSRICIEYLVGTDIDESDTDELKDDEKIGKQPGNGTQEPMKKTARDRDPGTHEQRYRDRDPRTREQTDRHRDPIFRGDGREGKASCPRNERWDDEIMEDVEEKRAPECAMEHCVDVPVPKIVATERLKEETIEDVKHIGQEPMQSLHSGANR